MQLKHLYLRARRWGWEDYWAGRNLAQNPINPARDFEHSGWREGWKMAREGWGQPRIYGALVFGDGRPPNGQCISCHPTALEALKAACCAQGADETVSVVMLD